MTDEQASGRLPERVEAPGLSLRRWLTSDVDALSAVVEANLEHLRPWMPWIAFEPLSRAERIELGRTWEERWLEGGDVTFAIELDGVIVGSAGLHRRQGPGTLEIGYWVDARHTGRGIATKAAAALTEAALGVPGTTRVEIHHDKANAASARVPAKLGYELVGETADEPSAPGEVGIDCCWRMTAERWKEVSAR